MIVKLPATTQHIGQLLSHQYACESAKNRRILMKILSSLRFLARQALPLRGHNDDHDGNLLQLMRLHGEEDTEVLEWLQRKSSKYLSPDMQNDLIKTMATHVLRHLSHKLQESPFISIMIDETTDVTNKEQVIIVFRSVKDEFEIDEDFVGFYAVPRIDAATLFSIIKDTLARFNLSIHKLRGQCYDGCTTMSGQRSGVAKRVQNEEGRAVFTHCYSHSLNLAASDSIKRSKLMKSTLETTYEITKLIKLSPRREALLKEIQNEKELSTGTDSISIKLLCPTRWTVRADSLMSIIENYAELLDTWDNAYEAARGSETKARIQGVAAQMNNFDFFFGVFLCEIVLRHTDNLSKTLQSKVCSAAEGQKLADLVVKTLQAIRNEDSFDLFWLKVLKSAESFEFEPELPRQRKRPRRYEEGEASSEFHTNPKEYFRQLYYEAIDLIMSSIKERFEQHGYEIYSNLEQLILKSCRGEEATYEFEFICQFYQGDIDSEVLKAQLLTFGIEFRRVNGSNIEQVTIFDIKNYFSTLSSAHRLLLSEVCIIIKLILVMPATNSTSERSFSALRRVKTYLRNTMTQQRLNNLMVLHVHKDLTDSLDLKAVAIEFIGNSEHRLNIFG